MTHHIAALGSLGGLGEQCGASDRGQKQLEIFQSVFEKLKCPSTLCVGGTP